MHNMREQNTTTTSMGLAYDLMHTYTLAGLRWASYCAWPVKTPCTPYDAHSLEDSTRMWYPCLMLCTCLHVITS